MKDNQAVQSLTEAGVDEKFKRWYWLGYEVGRMKSETAQASLTLPPTARQCHRIAVWCRALGIREPLEEQVNTRAEARDTMYRLMRELRDRRRLI